MSCGSEEDAVGGAHGGSISPFEWAKATELPVHFIPRGEFWFLMQCAFRARGSFFGGKGVVWKGGEAYDARERSPNWNLGSGEEYMKNIGARLARLGVFALLLPILAANAAAQK